MNITVFGAGAWGTALASSLARRHAVTLWARDPARARAMRDVRRNQRYLPDIELPEALHITSDWPAAGANRGLAILATPVAGLRPLASRLTESGWDDDLLWLCKGLEVGRGLLPHRIIAETMPAAQRIGSLSGPSFAQEVARGLPTALVLASRNTQFAHENAQALHANNLRVYRSSDVIGVEFGGAVKNVLALAVGISDGLQLGNNARAALITRGLTEMTRLGLALGGRSETFMGLAGVGDLILTATGDLSRNRRVGLSLASGKSLAQVLAEIGHVVEGVPAAREIARMASAHQIEAPITRAVCQVLFDGLAPHDAVQQLLQREPRAEY